MFFGVCTHPKKLKSWNTNYNTICVLHALLNLFLVCTHQKNWNIETQILTQIVFSEVHRRNFLLSGRLSSRQRRRPSTRCRARSSRCRAGQNTRPGCARSFRCRAARSYATRQCFQRGRKTGWIPPEVDSEVLRWRPSCQSPSYLSSTDLQKCTVSA